MINNVIKMVEGYTAIYLLLQWEREKGLLNPLFNTETQVYTLSAWPLGEDSIVFKCLHLKDVPSLLGGNSAGRGDGPFFSRWSLEAPQPAGHSNLHPFLLSHPTPTGNFQIKFKSYTLPTALASTACNRLLTCLPIFILSLLYKPQFNEAVGIILSKHWFTFLNFQ